MSRTEPAPFIRKVVDFADEMTRSWPVALSASLRFGSGEVAKVGRRTLADRTDAQGNIQPYQADDREVLGKLFGIEVD